jgi:hypothetical protein
MPVRSLQLDAGRDDERTFKNDLVEDFFSRFVVSCEFFYVSQAESGRGLYWNIVKVLQSSLAYIASSCRPPPRGIAIAQNKSVLPTRENQCESVGSVVLHRMPSHGSEASFN